ncbi:hypothetical protein M5F66_11060 [Acinetobacter sp. ANC 5033]|uniref:hypothetical protein n=1 Tax=Acinetobacter amyesii TaxID=2942470 RepID=UPI00201B4E77|nr:hypothetical protein [Acinetobacter amyesii]MCL6238857.1 hypothetical protein [Acinetobacter amyesii]
MKKFELINKSLLATVAFLLLPFWSYLYYGYFWILLLGSLTICVSWLFGRLNYNNKYFIFLYLIIFLISLLMLGAVYLTLNNDWITILKYMFLFFILDTVLNLSKIKKMQKKYKDDNFVVDGNLDGYSADFEEKNGKVWGDSLFAQMAIVSYMLFIGPYFIVINSPFEFYAGEMMPGIKSNLSVYAIILMILIFWEFTLKRFYFFSGLNYKFDKE